MMNFALRHRVYRKLFAVVVLLSPTPSQALSRLYSMGPPQQPPYQTFSPAPLREVETQAFLTRAIAAGSSQTAQTDAYVVALDELIRAAKAHGWWQLRDTIWMLAAPDKATAYLNLKGATFTLLDPATPGVFTAFGGMSFNGTNQYLKTVYTPSTAGGLFTQNSANISFWLTANSSPTQSTYMLGNSSVRIGWQNAAGNTLHGVTQRINSASTDGSPTPYPGLGTGMLSVNRSGASAVQLYHAGVQWGSTATASAAVDSTPFNIGGNVAGLYSAETFAYAAIGGSLTAQQVADEAADVADYLAAVGAIQQRWFVPDAQLSSGAYNPINSTSWHVHANWLNGYAYQRFHGGNVHRFEMRAGDQFLNPPYGAGDAVIHDSDRSEITSSLSTTNGVDHWVAYDVMFTSLPANLAPWFVVTQEHPVVGVYSGADAPQWALGLDSTNSFTVTINAHGTANTPRWTAASPCVVGRWYRIVARINSHPTTGSYDLYIDGVLVSSGTGLVMGYTGDAPYHVIGLYRQTGWPGTYIAYFANVQESVTGSLVSLATAPTGRLPQLAR